MKIHLNLPVFKTVILFLFILFVCGFDISAQFNSSVTKSATGFVENSDASVSRQRIVGTSNINLNIESNISPTIYDLEKTAFALLNQKRAENNLTSLEWSEQVAKIARIHSENMAKHKFFNHRGKDGLMVDDRADSLGISKWQAIGENIAFNCGYENPVEFAVQRWMLSPSHRENILNNRWRESAVGVAIGDDGSYYFTQVFLLRK
jgi:uncharacterized protein YkwD